MKKTDRLPDLQGIKQDVDDVFVYMKLECWGGVKCRERDIQYSVHIIAWMCELLISYSSRKWVLGKRIMERELTLEERIGVMQDVIPELLKCSSLFTRTNYDNKIQYFIRSDDDWIGWIYQKEGKWGEMMSMKAVGDGLWPCSNIACDQVLITIATLKVITDGKCFSFFFSI